MARDGDWKATPARARPPLVTTVFAGMLAFPVPDSASGARAKLPFTDTSVTGVKVHRTLAQPTSLVPVLAVGVAVCTPAARLLLCSECHQLVMAVACDCSRVHASVHDPDDDTENVSWVSTTARSPPAVPAGVLFANDVAFGPPDAVAAGDRNWATVFAAVGAYSAMCPRAEAAWVTTTLLMPPGLLPVTLSPAGQYIHVSAWPVAEFPSAWVPIFTHGDGRVDAASPATATWAMSSVPALEAAGSVRVTDPVPDTRPPFCASRNEALNAVPDKAGPARASAPAGRTVPVPASAGPARARPPAQAVPVVNDDRVTCPSAPAPTTAVPPSPPPPPPGTSPAPPACPGPPPPPPLPPPVTAVPPAPPAVVPPGAPAFPAAAVPPEPPPPPPPAAPFPPAPPSWCAALVLPVPPAPPVLALEDTWPPWAVTVTLSPAIVVAPPDTPPAPAPTVTA